MIEAVQRAAASSGTTATEDSEATDRQIDQLETSPITGKV